MRRSRRAPSDGPSRSSSASEHSFVWSHGMATRRRRTGSPRGDPSRRPHPTRGDVRPDLARDLPADRGRGAPRFGVRAAGACRVADAARPALRRAAPVRRGVRHPRGAARLGARPPLRSPAFGLAFAAFVACSPVLLTWSRSNRLHGRGTARAPRHAARLGVRPARQPAAGRSHRVVAWRASTCTMPRGSGSARVRGDRRGQPAGRLAPARPRARSGRRTGVPRDGVRVARAGTDTDRALAELRRIRRQQGRTDARGLRRAERRLDRDRAGPYGRAMFRAPPNRLGARTRRSDAPAFSTGDSGSPRLRCSAWRLVSTLRHVGRQWLWLALAAAGVALPALSTMTARRTLMLDLAWCAFAAHMGLLALLDLLAVRATLCAAASGDAARDDRRGMVDRRRLRP